MKRNKGITLIALTITIIVLLILASVATYSGVGTIKSSKLNKLKQELEIMQAEVNLLYEKYKDDIKSNIEITVGKDISLKQEKANTAFSDCGVTDTTGYRLYDAETIKELNIEGIEREYLVNVAKRDVICLDGFEMDGKKYYQLKDLTKKNTIEYGIPEEEVTFDINATKLTEGGWKIDISNIKFSKYVGKGTISYRKIGTDGNWTTPITIEKNAKSNQSYSFTVQEDGTYEIIIEDAKGKSGTNTQNLRGT